MTTAEIRRAVAILLDRVDAELGSEIELAADHYWLLESAAVFDLAHTPKINTGQLSDDLESVRAMVDSAGPVVWHDLDHLVGLLRRLAVLARP